MKRVTPSQARRNWFRLLDEVARGEVVVIERKGRRLVLQRQESPPGAGLSDQDYRGVISVPDLDEADRWGWTWSPADDLVLREEPVEMGERDEPDEAGGPEQ